MRGFSSGTQSVSLSDVIGFLHDREVLGSSADYRN